jgi:hypothetical protein
MGIIVAAALTVWMLLFLVLPTDLPYLNDQNAYLGGAAALRAGHGYRFEQYIDLPRIGMYPPGYSIWLALFWKNGQPVSVNSYRLELANWIAAGGALFGLAACLFLSELPTGVCMAIVMLFGTSLTFTQLTAWLMPDVLFVAGSCALALLLAAYNPDRKLSLWWFSAGLLAGGLCVVKAAAVAYMAGLGAYGLLKGDLRRLSRLACFALPSCLVMSWLLLRKGVPTYATLVHISEFGGAAAYSLNTIKVASLYFSGRWLVASLLNVPDRMSGAHAFLRFSVLLEALVFMLGIALFIVPLLLGIVKSLKQSKEQIMLCVVGAYSLTLFLWPYYDGARFGIPLIPFVVSLLWRGYSSSRVARAAFVAILVVNIPGNAWLSYKAIRSQEKESPLELAALQQAAFWINGTAGKGVRVAAGRDVPLTHLYEDLGRRLLANIGPNSASIYVDAFPAAEDNQWADYWITDTSRYPYAGLEKRFQFQHRFGKWTILSPRRE